MTLMTKMANKYYSVLIVIPPPHLCARVVASRDTSHLIRPFGPDWGAYTSASLPVFLMPLCQLRSISG